MRTKSKKTANELYTYTEFREKFFPALTKDDNGEEYLTRESFLDFLKKVSRPKKNEKLSGARKEKTSE